MSNPYSTPENRETTQESLNQERDVRGLQIITAGLAGSVLFVMGVSLILNEGNISGQPDIISWMGLMMACMMFVSHLILPNVIAGVALKKIDPAELQNADAEQKFAMLLPAFRTRHIVACAGLEAAAFFNLVGYLINQFVGNLIAASVLLVFIALRFPSVSSVDFWVKSRVHEIQMRQPKPTAT